MGSVTVGWCGSLDDRTQREKLCERLSTIAVVSHSFFDPQPSIQRYDRAYTGRIVVEATVFDAQQELSSLTRIHEHTADPMPFRLGNPLEPERIEVETDLFGVSEVKLHGLEFRLFDGRALYDDRVSFVFASFPEAPELGWRLVGIDGRARCQAADDDILTTADWFLSCPRLHMRYYCEGWMDRLLAWVKYFHVRDLAYWRYDFLPAYEQFAADMDALGTDGQKEASTLNDLLVQFEQEVAEWHSTAQEAKQFWSTIRSQKECK